MKIVDGKIKLEENDIQVGDFVLSTEDEYFELKDINSQVVHRIAKTSSLGMCIPMLAESRNRKFFTYWVTTLYLAFNVIPDGKFLTDVGNACIECIKRHAKDFYDNDPDISKALDDEIVKEQKELHEGLEEMTDEKVTKEALAAMSHLES